MQTGQGMPRVKLRSSADIDPALFTSWLRQPRGRADRNRAANPEQVPDGKKTTTISATTADPVGTPVGRHVWCLPRSLATVELVVKHRRAGTMAVTQIWRASRIRAADGRAPAASGRGSRSHRAGHRLWALLNAQALLNGTAGTSGGVALIEDDHRRMAARRAN
jgi:hypothetical protein